MSNLYSTRNCARTVAAPLIDTVLLNAVLPSHQRSKTKRVPAPGFTIAVVLSVQAVSFGQATVVSEAYEPAGQPLPATVTAAPPALAPTTTETVAADWLTFTVCPAITTAPARAALALPLTTTFVEEGPDPPIALSQAADVDVPQEHPDPVVTETASVPPVAGALKVVGETLNAHEKEAATDRGAAMVTVAAGPLPATAPVQPLHPNPVAAVAVSVTTVPAE